MVLNTPIGMLVAFLEGDFESAWDAVAATPAGPANRGNFMFARQAMAYLELLCRLCQADTSGRAIQALSAELFAREPRYFTRLPGGIRTRPKHFTLPSASGDASQELIGALFDMIRHGQAHQYQQINVLLSDGIEFFIGLSGAEPGLFLSRTLADGRPKNHLRTGVADDGALYINVRTDVLWNDLKDSVHAANLLTRGFQFTYLAQQYPFSSSALKSALAERAPG